MLENEGCYLNLLEVIRALGIIQGHNEMICSSGSYLQFQYAGMLYELNEENCQKICNLDEKGGN